MGGCVLGEVIRVFRTEALIAGKQLRVWGLVFRV